MPPKTKKLEDVYRKMTQHEHILARPDSYVGSIEAVTDNMWVFDESEQIMKQRDITWVPGLYKIFDEILVNAADNKVRDEKQSSIRVIIDQKEGKISIWNNGEGIPVQKH
eukprot:Tbor_TRINITY_DN7231_c0_g1::TRINITY_DN7231_c0_g1_i1::g.15080::m.15080